MSDQISAILNKRKFATDDNVAKTVFATLLDSSLPAEELSLTRLQHEAINLIGAGVESTKRALSVGSFHILDNPAILARLREELFSAIPDPQTPPPLYVYEKSPYLSACIEEGAFSFPKVRYPSNQPLNTIPLPLAQPSAYPTVPPNAHPVCPRKKPSCTNHMFFPPVP